MHDKTSYIRHINKGVFQGIPNPLNVVRYHSLIVKDDTLPPELEVSAYTSEGEITGIKYRNLPLEGVQFRPESILSEAGYELLHNFLKLYA